MAVLDVPPALSLYTVNALRTADAVVVPVQTHPFALNTVPRTLDLIDRVRRRLNPRLRLLGFLATLYDRHGRTCFGQRAHVRGLERADCVWRMRHLSGRRDRRR